MQTVTSDEFWTELGKINAAMLSIGDARHVPMSPYADKDATAIWFITAQGTDLVTAASAGSADASLIVTGNSGLHARIEGEASLSNDRAKLEELWNPVASTWFDGLDDPDIRLIRLQPKEAEVWLTDGAIGFLYQIVKSKLTSTQPDTGSHGTLRF